MQLAAAIWAVFIPQSALAYDHPLSDKAVRDAYFIGQDVKNVNQFLAPYSQSLPVPDSGPYVAEIALSTPFVQVVEASAQHSVGYSAGQAAEDYRRRGDFIAVRVKVLFTPTYPNPGNDFWRSVSVGLIQKKHMSATSNEHLRRADLRGGECVDWRECVCPVQRCRREVRLRAGRSCAAQRGCRARQV